MNYDKIGNFSKANYVFLHDVDDNGIQDVFFISFVDGVYNMTLLYNNLISQSDGFSISAVMVQDMLEIGQTMFGI